MRWSDGRCRAAIPTHPVHSNEQYRRWRDEQSPRRPFRESSHPPPPAVRRAPRLRGGAVRNPSNSARSLKGSLGTLGMTEGGRRTRRSGSGGPRARVGERLPRIRSQRGGANHSARGTPDPRRRPRGIRSESARTPERCQLRTILCPGHAAPVRRERHLRSRRRFVDAQSRR
jgi:hypothetical protein